MFRLFRTKSFVYKFRRVLAFFMVLALTPMLISCGDSESDESLADYGDYGKNIAESIAALGARPAGSTAESQTADIVFSELENMLYKPERQAVTLSSGETVYNIILRVPGTGFRTDSGVDIDDIFRDEETLKREAAKETFNKSVIIAARMCTEANENFDYSAMDGISDNASGVAALLTFAKELKNNRSGYDIILAFVAGGNDNFAGTRQLLASMTDEQRNNVECFYEVRNIYGGTRLYASAGWSAIGLEDKYPLRKKAYAVTDVSIESGLFYNMGQDILLNESNYTINSPIDQSTVLFREFSLMNSDYRVFDEQSIPVVLIESYDYSADSAENLLESRSPSLAETSGVIRGTSFDNTERLASMVEKNQLRDRINATAFLLIGAMKRSPSRSVALSE